MPCEKFLKYFIGLANSGFIINQVLVDYFDKKGKKENNSWLKKVADAFDVHVGTCLGSVSGSKTLLG